MLHNLFAAARPLAASVPVPIFTCMSSPLLPSFPLALAPHTAPGAAVPSFSQDFLESRKANVSGAPDPTASKELELGKAGSLAKALSAGVPRPSASITLSEKLAKAGSAESGNVLPDVSGGRLGVRSGGRVQDLFRAGWRCVTGGGKWRRWGGGMLLAEAAGGGGEGMGRGHTRSARNGRVLEAPAASLHAVSHSVPLRPLPPPRATQVSQLAKYESKVDKGMVMPFTPAGVSFQGIHYKVPMPAGAPGYEEAKAAGQEPELTLLTNITGSFRPGVLTALMGVSGAGKVRWRRAQRHTCVRDADAVRGSASGASEHTGHPHAPHTKSATQGIHAAAELSPPLCPADHSDGCAGWP